VTPPSDASPNELLSAVQHAVPDAVFVVAVDLGIRGLTGYWVGTSSGPPDRGLGLVSADGATFHEGADAFRRVLGSGQHAAAVLARAALLVLEHGGDPLTSASDVPVGDQGAAQKANVAAPTLSGRTLTYWSYRRRIGPPALFRSTLDLDTLQLQRERPSTGSGDAVADAIGQLDATDPNSRRAAIDVLVKACTDPRAPAALATTLATSPHSDTRASAAQHLATCHGPGAVDTLVTALEQDTDATVRQWVANALGAIKDTRARPALERASQKDPDENVRLMAQLALKKL
jgi:hypothetical protein